MEALSDLSTFTQTLTAKGYNGYFHTQGAYAGKLKESISKYLENCRNGTEGEPKPELLLTGYLQWAGEDKPRVECTLWVKHMNGKFFLDKMEVARKDRFGQLLKQSRLTDLSAMTIPSAMEAIEMVKDTPKQKAVQSSRRFKL